MGRLQAHTLFPLLTARNAPANTAHREPPHRAKIPRRARQNAPAPTTNKKPAFRRFLIVALTRTAKRPPALLTERNAPANAAQNTQPHCAENAYATRQNAPALCAKVNNKKPAFRRFLIAALTHTAKRPPALLTERNAPAPTTQKSTQQKTRLSAGSNRFKWWT